MINIKSLICPHRGMVEINDEQNSYKAIKKAIKTGPIFVEFDVFEKDGKIYTGHPPQEPVDKFEKIIKLFEGKNTFPKIDIKYKNSKKETIDKILKIIEKHNIKFALINIGSTSSEKAMEIEKYISKISKHNIMINIDLARYKENYTNHVKEISHKVFSISPEIKESNWEHVFKFAKENGIHVCNFWLRGWPDDPDRKVKVDLLEKAYMMGRKYGLLVLFDINKFLILD